MQGILLAYFKMSNFNLILLLLLFFNKCEPYFIFVYAKYFLDVSQNIQTN